ncbi:MAG TPA: thioesterase domain-containing protein [Ktedonobacterales bacterium]
MRTANARKILVERYLRGEVSSAPQRSNTPIADPQAPVVAVQTKGTKRPFFLLHGSSEGAAYFCYRLARELGDDQPFYSLDPYTHVDAGLPALEVIAAAHVRSLRSVQAEGPYLLGGICNGGLIASEMARQLQEEGQRVALVVMVDPWPAGKGSPASHRFARWAIARCGTLRHWDEQRQLATFMRIHGIARSVERWSVRIRDWLRTLLLQLIADVRGGSATHGKVSSVASSTVASPTCAQPMSCGCALLPHEYSALFRWAALSYDPPHPYDGALTYVWPSKERGNRRGWRARPQDMTYTVTGTQDSWRAGDLPAFASQLRSCIEQVHAPSQPNDGRSL